MPVLFKTFRHCHKDTIQCRPRSSARHTFGGYLSHNLQLLRANRLRWFGHVERSDAWIKKCRDVQVESCRRVGRPKKTWEQTIRNDREIWKMDKLDPHDRDTWRQSIATCRNGRSDPSIRDLDVKRI